MLNFVNFSAKCKSSGITIFPVKSEIKQNSIFVIDGFAESQKVIQKLGKKYPIYLVSGQEKIKLNVKQILVGQYYLTQAVLKPETNLTVGLSYKLVIDNLPKTESLTRWNSELKKYEPIVYKVLEGVDIEKPKFESTPKEVKKSLIHYGCGPAINVVFDAKVAENSEYLIKATVKNLQSGKMVSYYIKAYNGKINIGHGMCSGAFDFDDSENYKVQFSIMDASGNKSEGFSNKIKFTKPNDKNSSGYEDEEEE